VASRFSGTICEAGVKGMSMGDGTPKKLI